MATRKKQPDIQFEISLTAGPNGRLQAAYIHLRKAKAAKTKEIVKDTVLADYDSRGRLIGMEILGPVKIQVLAGLIEQPHRAAFRRFAKESIPPALSVAA